MTIYSDYERFWISLRRIAGHSLPQKYFPKKKSCQFFRNTPKQISIVSSTILLTVLIVNAQRWPQSSGQVKEATKKIRVFCVLI